MFHPSISSFRPHSLYITPVPIQRSISQQTIISNKRHKYRPIIIHSTTRAVIFLSSRFNSRQTRLLRTSPDQSALFAEPNANTKRTGRTRFESGQTNTHWSNAERRGLTSWTADTVQTPRLQYTTLLQTHTAITHTQIVNRLSTQESYSSPGPFDRRASPDIFKGA